MFLLYSYIKQPSRRKIIKLVNPFGVFKKFVIATVKHNLQTKVKEISYF